MGDALKSLALLMSFFVAVDTEEQTGQKTHSCGAADPNVQVHELLPKDECPRFLADSCGLGL